MALITFYAVWTDSRHTPADFLAILLFWPLLTLFYTGLLIFCLGRWMWLWMSGQITITGEVKRS
jgi:hypothetical protein